MMKYIKLFESFDINDYELIFSYLQDNDDVKVTFNTSPNSCSTITIEALNQKQCSYCEGESYIPGETYCPVCDGTGTILYFSWDLIKDTIYNLHDSGHGSDIFNIRWRTIDALTNDTNDKDISSLQTFIETIEENPEKQNIMYVIIFFKN